MSEFSGTRSWRNHEGGGAGGHDIAGASPGKQTLVELAPVQMRADAAQSASSAETAGGDHAQSPGDVHSLAGKGTATSASSLPYFDVVQAAFGHHDISGLVAHTGPDASATAEGMGAKGYTAGRHVVLGPGADLFTVAHEAAHFIEQQHGLVDLPGGVGAVGDVYEQRANAVAAKVVAGESAEPLLDQYVGGKGGTKVAARGAAESGPVQHQKTDLAAAQEAQVPAKLANARVFERRLGVAAFNHPAANDAATKLIKKLATAVIAGIDLENPSAEHKQAYADLFGKDNKGDDNTDRDNGAWSGGQVGKDFDTLFTALSTGNLREKMTGVYNAAFGGFKREVEQLMGQDRATIEARGFDAQKLKRRDRQLTLRKPLGLVGMKTDVYRDPGNPIDRKKYSNFEMSSDSRVANPEEERKTKRTVGDLDGEGIGLSEREKNYQYGTTDVDGDTALKWKEGGTWYSPNESSKWVQKYQQKLLMPVTAGPSGTALRIFQAWEFLGKPEDIPASHLRLALLGWMLTGNDHSFHEIMATSANYGLPYTPGVDAYREVEPLDADTLRSLAGDEGFPDEFNYRKDHIEGVGSSSVFARQTHVDKLDTALHEDPATTKQVKKGAEPHQDLRGFPPGEIGQVMALLVYTDDRKKVGGGVSAFEFINNVLKKHDSWMVMKRYLKKDPKLLEAYQANKFNIKELILEAKQHAKYAVEGMKKMDRFTGEVFRGYKTIMKPRDGETWTEQKFLSMSTKKHVSEGYARGDGVGLYTIIATMQSKTGRKIGAASMFGAEGEVLFAPGTRFRIEGEPKVWAAGGARAYEVTWVEDAPAPGMDEAQPEAAQAQEAHEENDDEIQAI